MSVINRMLLELDERHDSSVQHLPGMVRAVPVRLPQTSVRPWFWAALIIATSLLLGLFIWRATTATQATIQAPRLSSTTPPPLQLRSAASLDQARTAAAVEDTQPILIVAPPLIPAPITPTLAPSNSKPIPPPKKFILSARDDAADSSVTSASVIKTSSGAPNATTNMKHISPEQQADFRYREALTLVAQSRAQDAQTTLEDALRLDPKHLAARQALLSLFLKAKRFPQAEQILQEGLRLNLANAPLASALASVQLEQGDSAAALATLEKYASQANNNADYQGFYAALLQRLGRHTDAITHFQAALKVQPNRGNWLMGLGISLQAEKRYVEAEQAYNHARGGNDLSPDLLAFIEQRLQQLRQAR